jgi:hypothetical protein
VRPEREEGRLVTKQFVFEGDQLRINAECGMGRIHVEALDPAFEPYPGFSARECDALHDPDSKAVWHTVKWNGNSDVKALWNKPVMLRSHLQEAALYGFQFGYGAKG